MSLSPIRLQQGTIVSSSTVLIWRVLQAIVWLLGAALLYCLLFVPAVGLLLFWNGLIPVAPALLVIAPGVWRNVCPLATTNLLPRHLGLSSARKLSPQQAGWFNFAAVVALFVIVPLRHAVFNINGEATALLIIGMVIAGWLLGLQYEWKSAWCSGLCPVHPVEKLYGSSTLVSVPNMHCQSCKKCTTPCPDSTPALHPLMQKKNNGQRMAGLLITGGLPGFIWGWFQVPDGVGVNVLYIYGLPLAGMTISLCLLLVLQIFTNREEQLLTRLAAFFSVSCYYWFRIPSLLGAGDFAKDGVLIDIHSQLLWWMIPVARSLVTGFFAWWLLVRSSPAKSWTLRPAFEG